MSVPELALDLLCRIECTNDLIDFMAITDGLLSKCTWDLLVLGFRATQCGLLEQVITLRWRVHWLLSNVRPIIAYEWRRSALTQHVVCL